MISLRLNESYLTGEASRPKKSVFGFVSGYVEISLLAEGYHEKGRYELQYLPASLPDGSYFIVLSSDATLQVRKLMILR